MLLFKFGCMLFRLYLSDVIFVCVCCVCLFLCGVLFNFCVLLIFNCVVFVCVVFLCVLCIVSDVSVYFVSSFVFFVCVCFVMCGFGDIVCVFVLCLLC